MFKSFLSKYIQKEDKIINLFFQNNSIIIRNFSLEENFDNSLLNNVISLESLNNSNNLIEKYINKNNKYYKCIYQEVLNIPLNIWKPYKEFFILFNADLNLFPVIIDKYSETYISKMNSTYFNKRFRYWNCGILCKLLCLPNTSVENAPKFIDTDFEIISNEIFDESSINLSTYSEEDYINLYTSWKNYWIPSIQLTCNDTIQSNQYITFSIKAFHKDNQICLDEVNYYIEPIQGYTPNKEIKMINGEGTGKIYALGLNPGDKLRFKINSKYWTDLAEKILTVV